MKFKVVIALLVVVCLGFLVMQARQPIQSLFRSYKEASTGEYWCWLSFCFKRYLIFARNAEAHFLFHWELQKNGTSLQVYIDNALVINTNDGAFYKFRFSIWTELW